MTKLDTIRKEIRANYLPDEDEALKRLIKLANLSDKDRKAISDRAAGLVRQVRGSSDPAPDGGFSLGLRPVDQGRCRVDVSG